MLLLDKQYFIIRKGDFATNGNTKIIYCFFSSMLCVDDYINRNSSDCFNILIGSTIIWSFVEFCLHISKTRDIKPMQLSLYSKQIQLPQFIGIILQGFQEGGFITTLGLYYGDRIHQTYYQIHMHIFILMVIANLFFKSNIIKSSKRQINTKGSLGFIGIVTLYNMQKIYYYPSHNTRQAYMFAVMVYICSFWTFFAWVFKFRQVEVYTKKYIENIENNKNIEDNEYPYNVLQPYNNHGTRLETFSVLAYDVIFEIGIAYLTFYNLFIV